MGAPRFVGGSYELNNRDADVQRSVNLVPVMAEVAGSKSVAYLDSVPGLVVFSVEDPSPPSRRVGEDSEDRVTEGGDLRLTRT